LTRVDAAVNIEGGRQKTEVSIAGVDNEGGYCTILPHCPLLQFQPPRVAERRGGSTAQRD